MEDWEVYKISVEGDNLTLNGLMIWEHEWEYLGIKPFKAPHPAHPNQLHKYKAWYIKLDGKKVVFAASELSNMLWGICIPKTAT